MKKLFPMFFFVVFFTTFSLNGMIMPSQSSGQHHRTLQTKDDKELERFNTEFRQSLVLSTPKVFELDEKGWQEFAQIKHDIVCIGKSLPGWEKNKLIQFYQLLDTYSIPELVSYYAQAPLQKSIGQLYSAVTAYPQYQVALARARYAQNNSFDAPEEQWNKFRTDHGILLRYKLEVQGVYYPVLDDKKAQEEGPHYYTKEYLRLNRVLTPSAVSCVAAASFLTYYARQLQRKETGKNCRPIALK